MEECLNFELPKERTIFFNKDVDQECVGEVSKQIVEINEHDNRLKIFYKLYGLDYNPKPIKIFIDSYGGDIYACLGLLSIIKCSKTPVYTIVVGMAMSAGFLILISGHKRFCFELSTMLYHQVSSEICGTTKDIKEDYEETERLQKIMEKIIIENTKITKNKIGEIYKYNKDWYITPSNAIKLGVVDKILAPEDEILF